MAHPARVFWIIAGAVLLVDQLTKVYVRGLWASLAMAHPLDRLLGGSITPRFGSGDFVPLIGSALRLSFVRNAGAAFGLLPGKQPIFMATSLIVLIVVAAYWRRDRPTAWPVVVGLALVTSGAVGNLIDRAVIGSVTDFFDLAAVDFPVFNIADSAIVIGVGLLIAWLLFGPQPAVGPDPETGPTLDAVPQAEPVPRAGTTTDPGHDDVVQS